MMMRSNPSTFLRWLAILSLALLTTGATVGCGGGSESDDMNDSQGNTADAGMSGDASSGACTPDSGMCQLPSDFSFESQYEMRLTDFKFKDGTPGSDVNALLQAFLDQSRRFPVVVLLRMRKIDLDNGTVEVRASAGLKVDPGCNPEETEGGCDYKWEPEAESNYREVQINAENGRLQGELDSLDFVATVEKEDGGTRKFTIPIQGITLKQTYLQPDGEGEVVIRNGGLEGYVTEEDAKNAIAPQVEIPLSDVLGQKTDGEPNFDADDDGTEDAWKLKATFSAQETTIQR